MGIRKTIYIPDEATWAGIQEAAKVEGRSVSNYLVQLHRGASEYFRGVNESAPTSEEVFKSLKKRLDAVADKKVIDAPEFPEKGVVKADNQFFKPNPKSGKKKGK